MKCPHCNKEISKGEKYCMYCGTKIEVGETVTGMSQSANVASWEIAQPFEIARKIGEREFAQLEGVGGLIVHEGTTAVIYVDGREVAWLTSGRYDFVDNNEVDSILNQRIVNMHSVRGAAISTWRGLTRLIMGKKVGGGDVKLDDRAYSRSEVIDKLTESSQIAIYFKTDNPFPAIFGIDENSQFAAIPVRTRFLDAGVAVSMILEITDFKSFIRTYLPFKDSVSVSDIVNALSSPLRNLLRSKMRFIEIDEFGLAPEVSDSLCAEIKDLDRYLSGVRIREVTEITTKSDDFERFRAISQELYCSEKELEFLHRSNEFKNRVAAAMHQQEQAESREELSHKINLDEINKDGLIHASELDQFNLLQEKTAAERMQERLLLAAQMQEVNIELLAQVKKKEITEETGIKAVRLREDLGLAKQEILGKQDLEDLIRSHEQKKGMEDANYKNAVLKESLEGMKMADEYKDARREKELDFSSREEDEKLRRLQEKQKISLSALERMQEMKNRTSEVNHRQDMDRRLLTHEEEMAKIAALENANRYRSEAEARNHDRTEELLREMLRRGDRASEESAAKLQDMADKLLDLAKTGMATTAASAGAQMSKRDADDEKQYGRLERISETALSGKRPMEETVNCPQCKKIIKAGSLFCPHCGTKLSI